MEFGVVGLGFRSSGFKVSRFVDWDLEFSEFRGLGFRGFGLRVLALASKV